MRPSDRHPRGSGRRVCRGRRRDKGAPDHSLLQKRGGFLNAPTQEVAAAPARRKVDGWLIFGRYGALVLLLIMIIAFSVVEPEHFPTLGNLTNILSQLTIGAIVAMGLTVPLVAGEFDLSLGFQTSLLCVLAAGLSNKLGAHPLAIFPLLLLRGRRHRRGQRHTCDPVPHQLVRRHAGRGHPCCRSRLRLLSRASDRGQESGRVPQYHDARSSWVFRSPCG